jgi:epoxide hydrolase
MQDGPFRIEVPQAELDAVRDRLDRTRFTEDLPGAGWDYGVPAAEVCRLVKYWRDEYDWRRLEDRLNAYSQFTTTIYRQNVHFLHVRSARPDAGADSHARLAGFDHRVSAGDRQPARQLPPRDPVPARLRPVRADQRDRLGPRRIAAVWAELMRRLG